MWVLSIYATVTEHDKWKRFELIRQFRNLGANPTEINDRIEIRYTGDRDVVLQMVGICESCCFHDIHVSSGA